MFGHLKSITAIKYSPGITAVLGDRAHERRKDYSIQCYLQKKAFSRVGVKVWNKIPKEFKTLSKDSFNKQMKKSLFQILENEDSYLDVENISKLKECVIKSN